MDIRARQAPAQDVEQVTAPEEHDLVGIGIGPFNLSLAALADPLPGLSAVFLDGRPEFSWHPGLMLDGATLQVSFLADLVTLVDPTSRWSFLNYLREHDRMYPFYFAETFHVTRREYEHYCRWVAEELPSCRFGARVRAVSWDAGADRFLVEHTDPAAGPGAPGRTVAARNLVLGVGTEPVVPEQLRHLLGDRMFHGEDYLEHVGGLAGARDVTVIGSGQSGAEVFLDLVRGSPDRSRRVTWLTASPAFAPMEYSKLGLEHFTPDYTRFFRTLSQSRRDELVPSQWQLYKAISSETIAEVHELLYDRSIGGRDPGATLMPGVSVVDGDTRDGRFVLRCEHVLQGRKFEHVTDGVVLATGYAARRPEFLEPLEPLLDLDGRGRYRVDDDYRVATDPAVTGSLFVQNAEEHTHGVGAPDLGLGAWRGAMILNALTGRTAYRLPHRNAFTTFGLTEPAPEEFGADQDGAG